MSPPSLIEAAMTGLRNQSAGWARKGNHEMAMRFTKVKVASVVSSEGQIRLGTGGFSREETCPTCGPFFLFRTIDCASARFGRNTTWSTMFATELSSPVGVC